MSENYETFRRKNKCKSLSPGISQLLSYDIKSISNRRNINLTSSKLKTFAL